MIVERRMSMNENLFQRTQEWMQLERKTLEQRKEAEKFYESYLMNLVEEDFIKRNKNKVYERVEYLVVSVGTSYEPIVLSIKLFQPVKILFLYTAKVAPTLRKIVKYCDLEPMAYEKRKISETNPLDIYREIKRSYLEWEKPDKMYIDFTGGTKAMSAAAAMAGALIDVQLVYIGTDDYLVDFRKPNPGSETLYYISNPLVIFGDLEIEKALTLFHEYNYAGAQEKLLILKESIPDPNIRQQLNFVYLLAKVYEAWDALDFSQAYQMICELNKQLKRDRTMHDTFLMMDFCDNLEKQEQILNNLFKIPKLLKERKNLEVLKSKEIMTALMFTMMQNALIREKQEKYDMATLLFYRLLEMIEQRRLCKYQLFVSKMEYTNIKYNIKRQPEFSEISEEERLELLKKKIQQIKTNVFDKQMNGYLPEQVSLLEGFIILLALADPIVKDGKEHDIDKLKRIRSMVFLRNNSIFAHGLGPVGYKDYIKFKTFVLELFQEFCRIERIDYQNYKNDIEWLNPMDSQNYAIGMRGE